MVKIPVREDFAESMLDLKPYITVFKVHLSVFSPRREFLVKNWILRYENHFGMKGSLSSEEMREKVFTKWFNLFIESLAMDNLEPHYVAMVEFGRELNETGISLEELIFSLHFFEEVSLPLLMKNYPDKKRLTRAVFALDMLFHNELACLALSYFNRYRSEITRLEKMKDDLTHMIVHDMKNPASAISNAASALLEDAGNGSPAGSVEYLQIIMEASNALWSMAVNLLDISRMENGEMVLRKTNEDMVVLIGEILRGMEPMFREKKIKVSFRKGDIPPVLFDRELIKRVIKNLIDNALKFAPGGSLITLSVLRRDGKIFVSVKDRGPGIKKEDRKRIFEKFGQAAMSAEGKAHGTGLGLTFCKMAVEASGGKISLSSGKSGTTFSFYLPAF